MCFVLHSIQLARPFRLVVSLCLLILGSDRNLSRLLEAGAEGEHLNDGFLGPKEERVCQGLPDI